METGLAVVYVRFTNMISCALNFSVRYPLSCFFFFLMIRRPPSSPLFPYPPLFHSLTLPALLREGVGGAARSDYPPILPGRRRRRAGPRFPAPLGPGDHQGSIRKPCVFPPAALAEIGRASCRERV